MLPPFPKVHYLWKSGQHLIRQDLGRSSMKKIIAALLLILLSIELVGCQTRLDVLVINDLNERISVSVGSDVELIDPGKSAKLHYPSPEGREHGILVITIHGCSMSYKMPMNYDDYPWPSRIRGTVPLQLEEDLKLYAIPPDSTSSMPLSNAAVLQKGTFPLAPVTRDCH